jgi:hypothetical protein
MARFQQYINENIEQELIDRGLKLDDPRFPVIIDTKEYDVAYFPLFNLSGKFVGYQRYNPKGLKAPTQKQRNTMSTNDFKYYSYVTKENPEKNISQIAVYGLHTLDKRKYVFIVEGIFDAVKLIRLNQPVIAVMANHPKQLKNFFFALQKKIIGILDNDSAGKKLKSLTDISYTTPEPYKDLGDMSVKEVKAFISTIKGVKI